MEYHTITVNKDGRFQIPAILRKELHLEEGGELVAIVKNGIFQATTREQQIRKAAKAAQAFFVPLKKNGESVVDNLCRERREASQREIREFGLDND